MTGIYAIDRDALHRYLYRRADHFGRLKLVVKELATELELGYCNLTKVILEMVAEGRLARIGGTRTSIKTFKIVDPDVYHAEHAQVG